jgi:RNA chaperone Hfq
MTGRSSIPEKRVQEPFLNELRKSRRAVQVYLRSGQRLEGILASFDPQMIQLSGAMQHTVFKHEIMSIARAPLRKTKTSMRQSQRAVTSKPLKETARRSPVRPVLRLKRERRTESD